MSKVLREEKVFDLRLSQRLNLLAWIKGIVLY